MSASPPKEEQQVEQEPQSHEEEGPMERDPHGEQAPGTGYEFEVKEQDRWLPIANVARIMKNALPENAKIAKEAKECMQECVSEFISFITSEASEKCQQEKRKTVNGEDILFAMQSLGFENYAEALKIYLSKYRETQSARGENQNRPNSGYAGTGNEPTVGGGSATGTANNGSSTSNLYPGNAQDDNNLLGAQSMDTSGQTDGAYNQVYPSIVGANHNGEPY